MRLRPLLLRTLLAGAALTAALMVNMLAVGRGAPEGMPDALINLGHDTRLLIRPAIVAAVSARAALGGDPAVYRAPAPTPMPLEDTLHIDAALYPATGAVKTAIVLVHGSTPFARRIGLYRALGLHLSALGYPVLAIDQFGYGDSADPVDVEDPAAYRSAEAVCLAARRARTLGDGTVAVIGHSLGADASLTAMRREACADTLIAIGPARRLTARGGHPAAPELRYQARREQRHMGLREYPTDVFLATRVQLGLENHLDWLAGPDHAPVLFVDGALESADDLAALQAALSGMGRNVHHVTLPRADHYANTTGLGRIVLEDREAMGALVAVINAWIGATVATPASAADGAAALTDDPAPGVSEATDVAGAH